MSEENWKHLTLKGYCDWSQSLQAEFNRFFEATRIIAMQTPLGRVERLAEKAFQILLEKGKFTSYDAVKLGVLDTNQKKRLFSILAGYPNVHVDKRPAQYGDRKKIYVAWADDQKLAETEKDPDEELKQFIKNRNPTREQIVRFIGPADIASKKIGELVASKKIILNDKSFAWIGKD
jgi:hypothetical protein